MRFPVVNALVVALLGLPRVVAAETSGDEVSTPDVHACAEAGCGGAGAPFDDDGWRQPNRWRTVTELGMVLALGGTWYWIDRERQVADWDFPSLRDRFTRDAYINDNNPFAINYLWHAFGGSGFHVLGRSNDLGLVSSTLYGLGASLAWEYGIEYREKISLNDIIYTTAAGMAGGEFLHWLGRWLQQGPATRARTAARWSVGLPQAAHDSLDGRRGARGPWVDHEFRISAGGAAASAGESGSGALARVRFQGELQAFPDHLRGDRVQGGFRDGNVTSLSLHLDRGPDGGGADMLADTLLAGWRHRSRPNPTTATSLDLGAAVALRYYEEDLGYWRDRHGVVHLPGLGINGEVTGAGWRLRGKIRLHPDYAGVHAHSYDLWRDAHPDEVGKTILEQQGYYYAWGWSTRVGAELGVGRWVLGGQVFHARYSSQDGFDRFQETLTLDQKARDRYLDREAWLRVRLFGTSFIEARTSSQERHGQLEEHTREVRVRRHGVELGTFF